jgi:hypothetical protein
MMAVNRKHCPDCDEMRAASAFYPDRSKPDGLSTRCRECTTAAVKERAAGRPPGPEELVRRMGKAFDVIAGAWPSPVGIPRGLMSGARLHQLLSRRTEELD